MAAAFTGIVKTPITGMMLIIELTGMQINLLSLAIPVLLSFVIADVLKTRPLYDELLDNMLEEKAEEQSKMES